MSADSYNMHPILGQSQGTATDDIRSVGGDMAVDGDARLAERKRMIDERFTQREKTVKMGRGHELNTAAKFPTSKATNSRRQADYALF